MNFLKKEVIFITAAYSCPAELKVILEERTRITKVKYSDYNEKMSVFGYLLGKDPPTVSFSCLKKRSGQYVWTVSTNFENQSSESEILYQKVESNSLSTWKMNGIKVKHE